MTIEELRRTHAEFLNTLRRLKITPKMEDSTHFRSYKVNNTHTVCFYMDKLVVVKSGKEIELIPINNPFELFTTLALY